MQSNFGKEKSSQSSLEVYTKWMKGVPKTLKSNQAFSFGYFQRKIIYGMLSKALHLHHKVLLMVYYFLISDDFLQQYNARGKKVLIELL